MLVHALIVSHRAALVKRLGWLLDKPDIVLALERRPSHLWAALASRPCDVVVLDRESVVEGVVGVVAAIRKLPERPEVMVLQSDDDAAQRAELTAAGCLAVVDRELPDASLGPALDAVVERRREVMGNRLRTVGDEPRDRHLSDFAGNSIAMQQLLELARRVVDSDSSLLLLGETGVGKEWLARAIHSEGGRADAPFIPVNTSAVPDALLESELFGHERGAFTGAERAHKGLFELAHRGTIFLDEVGEMSPHLQVKLLRVLQEKSIRRLGAEHAFEVDVRVMAATNRDLDEAMSDKQFRRDLYYRLGVVTLTVPPLRARKEDIPDLALNYLQRFRAQLGRPIDDIEPEAMRALVEYRWPGNVRELINVMERAVLLCRQSTITLADLPGALSNPVAHEPESQDLRLQAVLGSPAGWIDRPLSEVRQEADSWIERRYLEAQLARCSGRIGETAGRSGITSRSLYSRMRVHGLRKENFRAGRRGDRIPSLAVD